MRFRKSIKITKGIKLNLSKTGASFTLGSGKGISFNIGNKGAFLNWSIPGTGVYDRVRLDTKVKGLLGGLFGGKKDEETQDAAAKKTGAKSSARKKGPSEEALAQLEQEAALIQIHRFAPDVESLTAQDGLLDADGVIAAAQDWLGEAEAPIPIEIQLDVCADKQAILIDLDLPEIEDMPAKKLTELASGELKIKEKTQKEKRADYQTCAFGLGEYVAANLFNLVPEAQRALVSAYTQRRSEETGDVQDVFLYSIVFERGAFANGYQEKSPVEFCGDLKGRFYVLSTGLMKPIVPYEAGDI